MYMTWVSVYMFGSSEGIGCASDDGSLGRRNNVGRESRRRFFARGCLPGQVPGDSKLFPENIKDICKQRVQGCVRVSNNNGSGDT